MARRRRDSALYYTVSQAAEVMGVCPDTVYRMVADGRLLCMHFGRAIRIPRHAVDPKALPAQTRLVTVGAGARLEVA